MMTIMSQSSVMNSHVQPAMSGSQRKFVLASKPVISARRSIIRRGGEGSGHENQAGLPRPRTIETTEQTKDIAEPSIDQSKTENIQPGNISSENAERRADIGATRSPTLFGKSLSCCVSSGGSTFSPVFVDL